MKKIGLLSDTHAYWDEKFKRYFVECDEIWHAGDIGSPLLAARFAAWKPFRAVYGNIDGQELRAEYPKIAHFEVEGVRVMMTHILRAFAYTESHVRPPAAMPPYQSRGSREERVPKSTHPRPFRSG